MPLSAAFKRDRAGLPLDGLNPYQPESVLITRPAFDVSVNVLPAGGQDFLSALLGGKTFGDACDAAGSVTPDVDIAAILTLTIASGALGGVASRDEGTSS